MLDVMVAINAAEFLVWGYSAQRAINHFEWTNRKIDMSAGGGASSGGWAGDELRRRVAARMSGAPTPPPQEEDDLPYSKEELVQAAASGFARGAKEETLAIGDGPVETPTPMTLEAWAKQTNDRIWRLEQRT